MVKLLEAAEVARRLLRQAAERDHPAHLLAGADVRAWARAEGEGSPAAVEAIRRTDREARIPGLAARPTVMAMGWSIGAAVTVAVVLSWFPAAPWIATVEEVSTVAAAAVAVTAAAWGILSEVRGWEGSDASRWLLRRRMKAFRRAIEPRRRAICNTLLSVGDGLLVVYRLVGEEGGERVEAEAHPVATIESLAFEPQGGSQQAMHEATHVALRLVSDGLTARFDWLPRDPGFEAVVAALAEPQSGPAAP